MRWRMVLRWVLRRAPTGCVFAFLEEYAERVTDAACRRVLSSERPERLGDELAQALLVVGEQRDDLDVSIGDAALRRCAADD
jgi:hypothetical protein